MKRRIIALSTALMLVASLSLFAQGALELPESETAVKVISVTATDTGYDILAQNQEGVEIIYHTSSDTDAKYPVQLIREGDVLAIQDNGMMTMSLPGQTSAVSLRNITTFAVRGFYNTSFAEVVEYPAIDTEVPVILSEEAPAEQAAGEAEELAAPSTLEERFSYAYGYDLISSYITEGMIADARYVARGVIDFVDNTYNTLIPIDDMMGHINNFFENVYGTEAAVDFGPEPASLAEVKALPAPETDNELFGYSYGFYLAYQNFYGGVEFLPDYFAEGALDAFFGKTPLLTEAERASAIDEYITLLQSQYEAYVAELQSSNLVAAEAFLADNATAEGVQTTESGLQYIVNQEGDGATPAEYDTVTVNYTLRDINGNILDQGTNASFQPAGTVEGFKEALLMMQVGESMRIFVHPSLGYGENGNQVIEPNALLIFDIELTGVTPAESAE